MSEFAPPDACFLGEQQCDAVIQVVFRLGDILSDSSLFLSEGSSALNGGCHHLVKRVSDLHECNDADPTQVFVGTQN